MSARIRRPLAVVGDVAAVAGIGLSWFLLSELNSWLFAGLEHTSRAHWIFLPAAFRPLIILLFGRTGMLGLVLGSYLTISGTTDAFAAVTLSLNLGTLPWGAVSLGKVLLDIPQSLAGLRARHIMLLCFLCAGTNAIALNGYLWLLGQLDGGAIQVATVFVGDMAGSTIVLLLISILLAQIRPSWLAAYEGASR